MKEDINEKIKVMQEFANGGEVESAIKGSEEWGKANKPCWDWITYDYRIKEKPKTRPLTFEELIPLVGTPVRIKYSNIVTYMPLSLQLDRGDYCFYDGDDWVNFRAFHKYVTRLDGTPFETEDK